MLLYLPERIYNATVKDDDVYEKMVEEATSKIFVNDFVKSMSNYENDNPYLIGLQNYVTEKTPEEYQLELKLCFDDDLEKYKDQYKDMDLETKMYWLCEVNGGDMKPTNDFIKRNFEFINYYENNAKHNPEDYSNFLHMMYYAKITYREIMNLKDSKEVTLDDVKNYVRFEEALYNKCVATTKDARYYNMLYSKREQMYVLYFEFVGIRCKDLVKVIEIIGNHLYQGKFKYNNFTYFRMVFNLKCFIRFMDMGDTENARKHWAKLASIINFAFQNKSYTIKALNHYNNSFLDEFVDMSKFCYIIDRTYMKRHYINIDHLMTQLEKRYYRNFLLKQEKKQLDKYAKKDEFYTYEWASAKKVLLGMIE